MILATKLLAAIAVLIWIGCIQARALTRHQLGSNGVQSPDFRNVHGREL